MIFRHIKTGENYRIVAFAIDEKTMTPTVVYQAANAEDPYEKLWTRPAAQFFDGRFAALRTAPKRGLDIDEIGKTMDPKPATGASAFYEKGGVSRDKYGDPIEDPKPKVDDFDFVTKGGPEGL